MVGNPPDELSWVPFYAGFPFEHCECRIRRIILTVAEGIKKEHEFQLQVKLRQFI